MSRLQLSIAFVANPRTWPILDGTVQPDGIDLVCNAGNPGEIFWRQLRFGDWDVAEMSFSSLMIAVAKGDDRFVGLPIFTTRRFFHANVLVRRGSGIDRPEDLEGKRVGVTEYQQTAALWTRGALQHEWGVRDRAMEFFMERTPETSHGGATGFMAPEGVTVHQIPKSKNIGDMMLAGELDAALHYRGWASAVNRSNVDLRSHPDIRPLFADPQAEGVRYYGKTGLFPINHGMCIKREIAERHPWVILNLVRAFQRAAEIADQQRLDHMDSHIEAGLLPVSARDALKTPLIRHGILANRKVLETAARYSLEQGLTPRLMRLDEVFANSTMDV